MSKGKKGIIIAASILVAAVGLIYALKPRDGRVTRAEIEDTIPPELKKFKPRSLPMRPEYRALQDVSNGLPYVTPETFTKQNPPDASPIRRAIATARRASAWYPGAAPRGSSGRGTTRPVALAIMVITRMAGYLAADAQYQIDRNRPLEAVKDAVALLDLRVIVQSGDAELATYMTSFTVDGFADSVITNLCGRRLLSRESAVELIALLEARPSSTDPAIAALGRNFWVDRLPLCEQPPTERDLVFWGASRSTRPNAAVGSYAELDTIHQAAVLTVAQMNALSGRWQPNRMRDAVSETLQREKFAGNSRGKELIRMIFQLPDTFIRESFADLTRVEAMKLYLGAYVEMQSTGKLPDTPGQLVQSGILKSIPMDFYSGQPFRYSRDRKVFWSVWEDAHDYGGKTKIDKLWDLDFGKAVPSPATRRKPKADLHSSVS